MADFDPISDVGEVDPEDAPACEACGDPIVEEPSHRVVTWIEDGEVQHRHFCGEDCLAEWEE
ncbi:MAG: hypothetical protein ABEI39_05885 [Halobacteriales archaeon]